MLSYKYILRLFLFFVFTIGCGNFSGKDINKEEDTGKDVLDTVFIEDSSEFSFSTIEISSDDEETSQDTNGEIENNTDTATGKQVEFSLDSIEGLFENRASKIEIAAINFYQNTKIPLMAEGIQVQNKWMSLIKGRETLLSIGVKISETWVNRPIRATVWLRGTYGYENLSGTLAIEKNSSEDDLESTINIEIPGRLIEEYMQLVVSLHEEELFYENGTTEGSMWPQDKAASVMVETTNGPLNLVLIPIVYEINGVSNGVNITDEYAETIKNFFWSVMPFAMINISIGPSFFWNKTVSRFGTGWAELLTAFLVYREQTGSTSDYYLGLINPTSVFENYCSSGCVNGISPISGRDYVAGRACITLGHENDFNLWAMLHEMGHALGRNHAPTAGDPGSVDEDYPYLNGIIGNTGYNWFENILLDGETYYDFMGYEETKWISDYTAGALAARLAYVNSQVWSQAIELKDFSRVILYSDGMVSSAEDIKSRSFQVSGEPTLIRWLDKKGALLEEKMGFYTSYSGGFAGLVTFERSKTKASYISIEGASHLIETAF